MEPLLLWGFALLGAALLLFVVELFVPSGGVLGVVSAVLAVGGVIAFWRVNVWWGVGSLMMVLALAPLAFNFAIKVMPHTPMGRRLILSRDDDEIEKQQHEERLEREQASAIVGATGVALTDLRPIGTAEIEGTRLEVLAEGGIIEAGTRVRVTALVDNQVKVRTVK